jgi:hypothetical protein
MQRKEKMTVDELFLLFNFHDGDLERIERQEEDIIVSFSLSVALQNEKVKSFYGIKENSLNSCLDLVLKFVNVSKISSDGCTNIFELDLQEFELWHIQYKQNIDIQLRNFEDNRLLTISFKGESVQIVSCERKN